MFCDWLLQEASLGSVHKHNIRLAGMLPFLQTFYVNNSDNFPALHVTRAKVVVTFMLSLVVTSCQDTLHTNAENHDVTMRNNSQSHLHLSCRNSYEIG